MLESECWTMARVRKEQFLSSNPVKESEGECPLYPYQGKADSFEGWSIRTAMGDFWTGEKGLVSYGN